MQSDGVLALADASGNIIWLVPSSGAIPESFAQNQDCQLVITSGSTVVWSSATLLMTHQAPTEGEIKINFLKKLTNNFNSRTSTNRVTMLRHSCCRRMTGCW